MAGIATQNAPRQRHRPVQITANRTLVRKSSITAGRTVDEAFDPAAEWNIFAVNSFDFLGSHTIDAGPPDPTEAPEAPDTGVVDADVTVPTSAACIELSTTAVSFGTQRFGSEDVAASPDITVTNCSGSDQTLLAHVTAAAGDGATSSVVAFSRPPPGQSLNELSIPRAKTSMRCGERTTALTSPASRWLPR